MAVRDSAGVVIVENRAPLVAEAMAWHLGGAPTLNIGSLDDDDESLARVVTARTFRDGRIGICDVGYRQVRVFTPDGSFDRAIGREGEGPGEFRTCGSIESLPGDTILVFDFFQGRVTFFHGDGEHIATQRLDPPDPSGGFSYLARLDDGSFLTLGGTNPMYLGEGSGLIRGAGWISRLDPEGESLGKILEFRTSEGLVLPGGAGYIGVRYAREHFVLAGAEDLVLGYADRFHFDVHDLDGAVKRIVRRAWDPTPVTRQQMAAETEQVRTSSSPLREYADDMEFPETHPAYDELLIDADGNIWVRGYRLPDTDGPHRWSVFDREGRWITDVVVPDELRVMEIGVDHVLALWEDELGVPYLRRYELVKPAGG